MKAIDKARLLYEDGAADIERLMLEYQWPNGVAVNEPDCFVVAYVTKTDNGDWAWHVKTAAGELSKLLRVLVHPAISEMVSRIPFISFRRAKTGNRMKTYRVERLLVKYGMSAI